MKVGIVSWGTAIPSQAVSTKVISASQGKSDNPGEGLGINQKTCPAQDEDSATLAIQATQLAFARSTHQDQMSDLGSILIGSESHPYAVKPTGTIVAQALGLPVNVSMADLQFACKAGTQAIQLSLAQVQSGQIKLGLAIGSDTAQSKPGDILEYTAGSGAGAYLLGSSDHYSLVANLIDTYSLATDTPDFWRRNLAIYPEHAGRFSAEPAYFYHITNLAKQILSRNNLAPSDIDYCIFHTPNAKFPLQVAQILGFTLDQLKYRLPVKEIGNTCAAAVPLALANVLDHASSHQKILLVSYGSGAGSDAFIFETTPHLAQLQGSSIDSLTAQISHLVQLSLNDYLKLRQRLH